MEIDSGKMELEPIAGFRKYEIGLNEPIVHRKIINIYRASAILEVVLDTALASVGLSTAQWGTLRIVGKHPGISGAGIARFAFVTPQAVTTMLQRLEQGGLITRRPSLRGRVVETHLTRHGEALLQKSEQIISKFEAHLFSSFNTIEQENFNNYLLRCIENLDSKSSFEKD